jgi:branched-chain amino acid transport system substrate-binding protein
LSGLRSIDPIGVEAGHGRAGGIPRHAKLDGGFMKVSFRTFAATLALAITPILVVAQPVQIAGLVELSGGGASVGTNFDNGVKLAVKEINAAGGLAGRKIEYTSSDTQTNPSISKALAAKAVDSGVYVVMGPVFSGSIVVSMNETRRAEVTNVVGGEAASITQQGNPYVFRCSFTQAAAMPKVAKYMKDTAKAKTVAVIYVNNDFGKGGRDVIVPEFKALGIEVVADISTDQGQLDFSGPVLKAKQSNADALFVYLHEEESARILRELRKQGYDKPIIGETTLANEKVIELAGDAANGVVAHVGLTADAPNPTVQAFVQKFQAEYKYKPDHNAMKGYTGMWAVKAVTDKIGKVDTKALAAAFHGATISAKDYPGVLFDVQYDNKGDLDRESVFVKIANGRAQVVQTFKPVLAAK